MRERALPTNYILGYFQGPSAKSPDYDVLQLATSALSGQLFAEIRTRRNLSYAVNAPFLDRALSAGGLYVTTTEPDSVLDIMRSNIILMQANLVDPAALDHLIQQFITQYFLDNETDADQADFPVAGPSCITETIGTPTDSSTISVASLQPIFSVWPERTCTTGNGVCVRR